MNIEHLLTCPPEEAAIWLGSDLSALIAVSIAALDNAIENAPLKSAEWDERANAIMRTLGIALTVSRRVDEGIEMLTREAGRDITGEKISRTEA